MILPVSHVSCMWQSPGDSDSLHNSRNSSYMWLQCPSQINMQGFSGERNSCTTAGIPATCGCSVHHRSTCKVFQVLNVFSLPFSIQNALSILLSSTFSHFCVHSTDGLCSWFGLMKPRGSSLSFTVMLLDVCCSSSHFSLSSSIMLWFKLPSLSAHCCFQQ